MPLSLVHAYLSTMRNPAGFHILHRDARADRVCSRLQCSGFQQRDARPHFPVDIAHRRQRINDKEKQRDLKYRYKLLPSQRRPRDSAFRNCTYSAPARDLASRPSHPLIHKELICALSASTSTAYRAATMKPSSGGGGGARTHGRPRRHAPATSPSSLRACIARAPSARSA